MTGGFKELKRYLDRIYFDKPTSYQSRIIGVILLIIGIVFLYKPSPLNIKIGITSILIGTFLIFMVTGKITTKGISDAQITLVITTWILIMFFITVIVGNTDFDIFIILIFIGLLMVKELTFEFSTVHLKKRMDVFIYMFLIIFIVIVTKKIISISGI